MFPKCNVVFLDLESTVKQLFSLLGRFIEFYVDELEETQDLKILVSSYLRGLSLPPEKLDGIVQ